MSLTNAEKQKIELAISQLQSATRSHLAEARNRAWFRRLNQAIPRLDDCCELSSDF